MRILMVVPMFPYPVVGGLERQALELSKALIRGGATVQALSGTVAPTQPTREVVDGINVRRISWPSRKWLRLVQMPFALWRAMSDERDHYDVIHLHQHSWFGLCVILLAHLIEKPILTKIPNVDLPSSLKGPLGWFRRRILFSSDALVALSAQSLDELRDLGFPRERILATPNGIALDSCIRPVEPPPTAERPCCVVFIGRLHEEKGLDSLLLAWCDAMRRITLPATLELWGAGPLDQHLRKVCDDLHLTSTVSFRGHVDGVRDQLLTVDALVLPSQREGNSNAVLEAMAAAVPVVGTHVGGTPMLVGPEGECFLSAPDDTRALADNLVTLIGDAELRRSLGAAMRRRVETHFDIDRVASTYANAYGCLARRQRDSMHGIGSPIVESA